MGRVTSSSDILALFDYVHERLQDRLTGVTPEELDWAPTSDADLSLRWRLQHIAETLGEDRNRLWLDVGAQTWPETAAPTPGSVASAYAYWRGLLQSLDDESSEAQIGAVGGPYGQDTRRSFALHVLDELIHHGAEAALLRDLYAHRSTT